jgi:hypothetical protein
MNDTPKKSKNTVTFAPSFRFVITPPEKIDDDNRLSLLLRLAAHRRACYRANTRRHVRETPMVKAAENASILSEFPRDDFKLPLIRAGALNPYRPRS